MFRLVLEPEGHAKPGAVSAASMDKQVRVIVVCGWLGRLIGWVGLVWFELVGGLVDLLVGWLVGWLVGRSVGRFVEKSKNIVVCPHIQLKIGNQATRRGKCCDAGPAIAGTNISQSWKVSGGLPILHQRIHFLTLLLIQKLNKKKNNLFAPPSFFIFDLYVRRHSQPQSSRRYTWSLLPGRVRALSPSCSNAPVTGSHGSLVCLV